MRSNRLAESCVFLRIGLLAAVFVGLAAPSAKGVALYGYGAEDANHVRNVGGNYGAVRHVYNYDQYKSACETDGPVNIYVHGKIDLRGQRVIIGSNKTIQGANHGSDLIVGNLYVTGSNVIICHLSITNPTSGDGITVWAGGARRILIYHCDIYDCDDCGVDVTAGATDVTIAYCKFTYRNLKKIHRFASEIWAKNEDCHVTFHHCWFGRGMQYRLPLVSGWNKPDGKTVLNRAYVHSFCNYYSTGENQAQITIAYGAYVKAENNYYYNEYNPWVYPGADGICSLSGSYGLWSNGHVFQKQPRWGAPMIRMQKKIGSYGGRDASANFGISYPYALTPSQDVRGVVIQKAGNIPAAN